MNFSPVLLQAVKKETTPCLNFPPIIRAWRIFDSVEWGKCKGQMVIMLNLVYTSQYFEMCVKFQCSKLILVYVASIEGDNDVSEFQEEPTEIVL